MAAWAYSFEGSPLAWEQHQEAEGFGTGDYLMDLTTGDTTRLPSTGGRPLIAGNTLTYFSDALQAMDLTTKKVWTVNTRGDWIIPSEDFVAYLRVVRRQRYKEIVAVRLADHSEQILGHQEAYALAASDNHIAFVGDDGKVKLFEWRTD